jgi:hypothetical protein
MPCALHENAAVSYETVSFCLVLHWPEQWRLHETSQSFISQLKYIERVSYVT